MADYSLRFTAKDEVSSTINQVKKEIGDLGKQTSKIEQIDKKFEDIANSSKALNTKVKQTGKLLSELKFNGDYNAKQFLGMAKAAGEAKDAISDTQAIMKFFADDRRWLNTTVQGFQALAGVGSVATGVMTMFGTETEEVTQAILYCQQALTILNGVKTVANLLDKEGYLMTAKKVIGLQAEAAATDKATAAQVRNNLAVMANPYVLAAAAIAALVGGIIYWTSTMKESTEEQERLTASVNAFEEAANSQTKQVADQLTTFYNLKNTYDECGGKVDKLKEKILDNKEAQRKLGVTLKTVDDVHRLFGRNSEAYINATLARATALAAETAQATLLGNVLSELTKIYGKLRRGEEVNYSDIEKVLKGAGLNQESINKLMRKAGGRTKFELFGKNDLYVPEYAVDSFAETLDKELIDAFYREGAGKDLGRIIAENMSDAVAQEVNFNDLLSKNDKGGSRSGGRSGSGGSSGSGNSDSGYLEGLKNKRAELIKQLTSENKSIEEQADLYNKISKLDVEIADYEKKVNDEIARRVELIRLVARVQQNPVTASTLAGGSELARMKALTPSIDKSDLTNQMNDLLKDIEKWQEQVNEAMRLKALEEQAKKLQDWSDTFGEFGSAFSNLGNIFSATGDKAAAGMMQIVSSTMDAVSQIIPQIMKLIGVKEGEALASGTASAAGLPFPANLGAIAAIVASVLSVFATVASVVGSFASGGIIGGGSNYGDHVLARVNSGEMVLNKRQQTNLFKAIESGNIGGGATVLVPDFRIKGSDLYCSLRNYSKSVGKTGKVTGIR